MAPTTLSLANKTAIVTGSGRENGIGAAIAVALAQNGARVVVNYVSDASAARAAKVVANIEALGAEAIAIQADVSSPEGASTLVNNTRSRFATDKIDILSMPAPYQNHHEQTPPSVWILTPPPSLQSTTPARAPGRGNSSST
jgi:NAD(P)-dependent dehydrogenase (short-subunit alcohol dehydrogenase family)